MTETIDDRAEIREIEARLRRLGEACIERSQGGDGDALDLLARGVALQRAAFLLRAELADPIDLRDGGPLS
jgi:hypothetical protein